MKDKHSVRVYYLASGALGVPILETLRNDTRIELVGVGTQPDRQAGRKKKLTPTPVGRHADETGIKAERLASVNDEGFLDRLRALEPTIIVVASFGQMLREKLIGLAPFGCFNIHTSILPRHRGASPIQTAILEGDRETGISFMQIDEGCDTGAVYKTIKTPIDPNETSGELELRLANIASSSLVDTLFEVLSGNLKPTPQPAEGATYARKLSKADAEIDWQASAEQLERAVRAFQPWPCAYTSLPTKKGRKRLQLLQAKVVEETSTAYAPGQIVKLDRDSFTVACGNKQLAIHKVVPEGKRAMSATEFLRGARLETGQQLC